MSENHQDLDVRAPNGQWIAGCRPGPGRPRRVVEADRLAVLSESVSADDWREIIARAVADSKAGDPRARAWLSGYLLGPPSGDGLLRLAGHELAGVDPVDEAAREAAHKAMIAGLFSVLTDTR